MSGENHLPPLPDEAVLRAHAHIIGNTGSGKRNTLLNALGLEHGDNYGRAYFVSVSAETLANYRAAFGDVPPPAAPDGVQPNS